MINFFLACVLWIIGAVVVEDEAAQNVQARGKCREIYAEDNVVIIEFLNEDDAKIFARDLNNFLNKDETKNDLVQVD